MLRHQRTVDVFHAVKTLRNNKPNMVDLLVGPCLSIVPLGVGGVGMGSHSWLAQSDPWWERLVLTVHLLCSSEFFPFLLPSSCLFTSRLLSTHLTRRNS